MAVHPFYVQHILRALYCFGIDSWINVIDDTLQRGWMVTLVALAAVAKIEWGERNGILDALIVGRQSDLDCPSNGKQFSID
jgi:hypothetical protein